METVGPDMLNLLPNTITSFSKNSQTTVRSLVREMKLDKVEFNRAMASLAEFSSGSAFAASRTASFSIMDRQILVELFRDAYLKIQKLFTAVNGIGLGMNSMVSIFSSEIEKIEKDVEELELFINNYEFLAGKDDLFNSNYIEKFDNFLNDYRHDGSNFLVPDRDGTKFPLGGNGFIDSSIGIFKFGSSIKSANVIDKIKNLKIASNYGNYITSSSDPKNVFTASLKDSWNVTVKSPSVLTSEISEYSTYIPYDTSSYRGAQTIMDVTFSRGVSLDTLRLTPNSGGDLFLMQASVFPVGSDEVKNILTSPIQLGGAKDILLSKTVVQRVILIFNQQSYTRSKAQPIVSELNSRAVNSFVQERVRERNKRFSKYQDMMYWYFRKKTDIKKLGGKNDYDFYSNRVPFERDYFEELIKNEVLKTSNLPLDSQYDTSNATAFMELVQNAFRMAAGSSKIIMGSTFVESAREGAAQLLNTAGHLYKSTSTAHYDVKDQFYNYPIVSGGVKTAIRSLLNLENSNVYEYLFSMKSIEFIETDSTNVDKVAFVSKAIPTDGQVVAVKAKVDALNSYSVETLKNYDIKIPVSYEFSVSNTSVPDSEEEWHPVAFNGQRTIESEVLFLSNPERSCKLRFRPADGSIIMYQDGKISNNFTYNRSQNKIEIKNRDTYSGKSIYCVKYDLDLEQYDPHVLDFAAANILRDTVRSYSSGSKQGQTFMKTGQDNTVKLDFTPYVRVEGISNTRYASGVGTIFAGADYSPVKIRLKDNSYAVNLTNYTGRPQDVNLFSTSRIAFIQTGSNLVFNRPISDPFDVYYDYIPVSLRFRFIARRNTPEITTPLALDTVILKMKTLNFDPYYDKLSLGVTGK
jgi:hypothetical protein